MKKGSIVLLVLILMCASGWVGYLMKQPVVVPVEAEIPGPEVKQGRYTIFQYTQIGWTNRVYITEYFIEDNIIHYKEREHQDEYIEMPFEDCLIEPKWVEENEELMDFGFWEYSGEEYNCEF